MKKSKTIVILLLAFLLVTGSLAKESFQNHIIYTYGVEPVSRYVELMEDYDELNSWDPTMEPVKRAVYVTNRTSANGLGQDAYVRIQFREFIAEANVNYIYSEDRFLIDNQGEFVKADSKELALILGEGYNNAIQESDVIQKVSAFDDLETEKNGGFWYIKTINIASSGIYGKFLIEKIVVDSDGYVPLHDREITYSFKDDNNNLSNTLSKIDNDNLDTEDFIIQSWKGYGSGSKTVIRDYVKLNLGANVVSLDTWRLQGRQSVNKWILDTESDDGWAYWGNPLKPPADSSMVSFTSTDVLLESVELLKYPKGKIKYHLDVQLDAVSLEDLVNWNSAPRDLIQSFINESSGNLNYSELEASYRLAVDKSKRLTRTERYDVDSLNNFTNSLAMVEDMLSNRDAENQMSIDKAKETLDTAKTELQLNINYDGTLEVGTKIIDFAGKNWTVLNMDDLGNVLIISDTLSEEELKELESLSKHNGDTISFSDDGNFGTGYDSSNLKLVNDEFYSKHIQGKKEESFIQPIVIGAEQPLPNTDVSEILLRKDAPSKVDMINGNKQAFTLSISDWNTYASLEKPIDIFGNVKMWTTTPGLLDKNGKIRSVISVLYK